MNKIYALIAEGKGERVVLNLLLDNDKLIFSKENLLDGEVLTTRSAKQFEQKHMNFKMESELHIYRVLDSINENFKLSRKNVVIHDILTRPEIEMLIIIDLGKYNEYQKYIQNQKGKKGKKGKASEFLKIVLPEYNKGERYWGEYYENNIERLIDNIKEHDEKRPSGERTIYELIKK